MEAFYAAPQEVDRFSKLAIIVGVAGSILLVATLFFDQALFFRSYLVAYVFWTGVAIGSLAIMMLHHLSGGAWGLVIRRLLEAATRTLPLIVLLFVPVVLGMHSLYEWTHADVVQSDPALLQKSKYLNAPFFLARAVFYFTVWGLLIYFLNKWSAEQDTAPSRLVRDKMQGLSGPGILLFGLTVTFAAVDWVMSLEPHWFSTIFGLLIMAGWGLSSLALTIAVAMVLARRQPMSDVYAAEHFHDLGKLLLAFVMIYAYFAFSQFLIIWSANLPEEIPWYLRRLRGGWQWIGLGLVLFHFALPFLLLLSRDLKRSARMLSVVAIIVIIMRVVDLIWLVAPAFQHGDEAPHVSLIDFAAMFVATAAVGGFWIAFYIWQLKKRPLLPLNAPGVEEALEAAHHH